MRATFDIARTRQRTRVSALSPHVPGLSLVVLTALWMMRRFIYSAAVPAGTDMLGFISRARQNASFGTAFSMWSPAAWGAVRPLNLENVLGLLTMVTSSPWATVRILDVATYVATGACAYLLAWRLYGRAPVAAFAGVAFMCSQATLSRWASGQLNIEMATAAAPLLVLLWIEAVEKYTRRRAARFGVVVAAVMLVRPDMVFYVAPFLALHAVLDVVLAQRARRSIAVLAKVCGITFVVNAALGAYQIVPVVHGIKAQWFTGGLFSRHEFVTRSLDAYDSILGFGREVGYLGFTGQETWFFHPWIPLWLYRTCATLMFVLAVAALRWHRDRRTLFLLGCVLLGSFLAKGIRAPIGQPYLFAIQHVPLLSNIRAPGRWLIVVAFAESILAGLTLVHLAGWARAVTRGNDRKQLLVAVGALAVAVALVLPAGPTLVSGFRTWTPDPQDIALLESLQADHTQFAVATVPYDQASHFVVDGSYRGFEHDLGSESALWTGHPALGDGGWNQEAADDIAFTSTLLRNADPAYLRLLAASGVKYLVRFDYPENAPHLLPLSLYRHGWPNVGVRYQQTALRAFAPPPARIDGGGAVYRLPGWTPAVSFKPNLAVVLGGRAGLAALADLPDVRISDWAAVTADDAVRAGGLGRLAELVRGAQLLVHTTDGLRDVALLAAPPAAVVPGMTSDLGLDQLTELLASDASDRTGSLADESVATAAIDVSDRSVVLTLPRRRRLDLWARIQSSPTPAEVSFAVDGRTAARVLPLAPIQSGFRWLRVAQLTLGAGSHTLRTTATPSVYGDTYELDETKLVDPRVVARDTNILARAVGASRAQQVYAFDVDALQAQAPPPRGRRVAVDTSPAFWSVLDTQHSRARASLSGVRLSLGPGREFYTVVEHRFARPTDWRGRQYIYLRYRGNGSGRRYHFFVDFDTSHSRSASWSFVDSDSGWHTVAFATTEPEAGTAPFSYIHVFGVRLATEDKDLPGTLDLGRLALSPLQLSTEVPVQLGRSTGPRVLLASGRRRAVTRRATTLGISVFADVLGSGRRVVVRPSAPIAARPAPPVRFTRTGPTTYRYEVDAPTDGFLALAQAYDPRWTASQGRVTIQATPVLGVEDGFQLEKGRESGTISFAGQTPLHQGLLIAVVALLVLLPLVALPERPRWRIRSPNRST